ncbi:MAG TPA: uroporphyrinogen-III C-methyltransferase [Gemmataceae bacterium]|nr:uroporphyrinogen-III C-methyltransferase [Gemmataceae bacterium]
MAVRQVGRVYLVGAGPGDVGLLTLRAVECLRSADFVLYDYLTSPRTLDFARPDAERFRVTQLPGTHPERWRHIIAKLIEEARKGKVVVHLKGGDPLVFGRGAEEAEALRAAGVPYEIVPGVTAALAAAACTEIPLTHRAFASAVALVTGHEEPGKAGAGLDWGALANFPGTLAVYMGVTQLGHIAHELIARGMSPDTPAALVYRASTGDQRTVTAPLGELEAAVRRAGLTRPSLLLIGPAVGSRPTTSWFEERQLAGLRVVVTRPRDQALGFARRLELLGAVAYLLPAIEVREPADWGPADAAIRQLRARGYDWVVFTSANGVAGLLGRLRTLGLDGRAFSQARLAAIGPATADALREAHLITDLVPAVDARSEQLADLLSEHCRGNRVLLAQATQGREVLREHLGAIASVDVAPVYEQVSVADPAHEVFDRLRRGEIDAVTLTSPNIAAAFLAACDETVRDRFRTGPTRLVANSERLARFLGDEGYPAVVCPDPTADGLIAGLKTVMAGKKGDEVGGSVGAGRPPAS